MPSVVQFFEEALLFWSMHDREETRRKENRARDERKKVVKPLWLTHSFRLSSEKLRVKDERKKRQEPAAAFISWLHQESPSHLRSIPWLTLTLNVPSVINQEIHSRSKIDFDVKAKEEWDAKKIRWRDKNKERSLSKNEKSEEKSYAWLNSFQDLHFFFTLLVMRS